MSRWISQEDECPACGAEWVYLIDGRPYSHIVGIYDLQQDRTVAWKCPFCGEQWDRGAVVVS